MKEFTARALDRARDLGASYADIRVVETQRENITVRNGKVESLSRGEEQGFGVRVLASVGDGPVDAIYSAIQRMTGVSSKLMDYRIRAVSRGKDAQGEVQIELEHSDRKIRGRGLSTDILEASALAYLSAINRLRSAAAREQRLHPHAVVEQP